MTIRWAAWAVMVCVIGMPVAGYAEQFMVTVGRPTVAVEGREFLLSEDGHMLRDGMVTPSGLALCAAMKIPLDRPCEWDVIVDASRSQTDPALWVNGFQTNTDQTAPEGRCCWASLAMWRWAMPWRSPASMPERWPFQLSYTGSCRVRASSRRRAKRFALS